MQDAFTQNDDNSHENEPIDPNAGYVFISYSSEIKDTADAMRNMLHKNGIATWMAPYNILVSDNYGAEICTAIENCSCFLLLLTKSAQESPWVPREIERAIHYKKRLFSLQLEDFELENEFAFFLSRSQRLPIQNLDGSSSEIQKLIHTLKKYTTPSN